MIIRIRDWYNGLSITRKAILWAIIIGPIGGLVSLAIGDGLYGEKQHGKPIPYVNPMDAIRQGAQCIPDDPDGTSHCCECHPKYCGIKEQ